MSFDMRSMRQRQRVRVLCPVSFNIVSPNSFICLDNYTIIAGNKRALTFSLEQTKDATSRSILH
jgi:hypothetical protein